MTRNRQHPFGNLWSELNQAQDEFARWVNRLNGTAAAAGPELSVWEDEHAVYAEADLPGLDPAQLDADKVDARYEAGVLRLTLPKHEAAKPRKIQVKGA